MKTQKLGIQTPEGTCDSFVAYPSEGGPFPAVILLMDAFGPRDYLYEMTKTLASNGYYVLLPNLFYRSRPAPVIDAKFPLSAEDMAQARPQLMPLFQSFKAEQAMSDMKVFLDFLSKQKEVRPGPIGATGYCMGGGLAIRAAALYPDKFVAAASFHSGGLATDAPDSPHKLLGKIKAELYFGHADNDQHMTPEQMETLKKALDESGLRYEAELYKGAAHGFTQKDLPAYNAAALKHHWEKLLPLFQRTLKP
jgi:carboxymethylenebutenolidase